MDKVVIYGEPGRILPSDPKIEEEVLGALMLATNKYPEVCDILSKDCFYKDAHQILYEIIRFINERGDEANILEVMREARKKNVLEEIGGEYYITELTTISNYFLSSEIIRNCQILRELAIRRSFLTIAAFLEKNSYNEDLEIEEVAEQTNKMIADLFRNTDTGIITLSDAINNTYKQIELNSKSEKSITGARTGFEYLDRKTGGLHGGDLTLIAAETSQGKSSLAMAICKSVTMDGTKIAFYSLEMSSIQLTARLLAMGSGIPANKILYSRFDADDYQQLDAHVSQIYNLGIYYDEKSTSSIDNILNSARHLVLKEGIKGIVVDYLQLVKNPIKGGSKEQEVGEIARKLKNIAKELNIFVIALSQLSRNKNSRFPTMDRLRDSGQLEEAADNIILIYRPEAYMSGLTYPDEYESTSTEGTAMIICAKGRSTGIGRFICGFKKETTLFYDLNREIEYYNESKRNNDPF